MNSTRTVLFIDAVITHADVFRAAVLATSGPGLHVEWARTFSEGLKRLRELEIWAIVINLFLPDSQGLDTLDKLLNEGPGVPILVLAGADDDAVGIEALRRGAKDYLLAAC